MAGLPCPSTSPAPRSVAVVTRSASVQEVDDDDLSRNGNGNGNGAAPPAGRAARPSPSFHDMLPMSGKKRSSSHAGIGNSATAEIACSQFQPYPIVCTYQRLGDMELMRKRPTLLELPYDIVIEVAGLVAATSPHPMEDLCSLRGTCQTMREACMERAVKRRVALEQEESMRWSNPNRYLSLIDKLAAAGNPDACFVLGLRLVFTQGRTEPVGTAYLYLTQAARAGHKVAAYVLGVLHCGEEDAKQYIKRQVEGDAHGKGQASRTNREFVRYRNQAVDAVREEVMWRLDGMMEPMPVPPPEVSCKGSGCGVAEGWTGECTVFCSDGCRIRHEYSEFFSRVSSFLN